jgi:hypothetical protein
MDHAAFVAGYAASARATIAPIVADFEALAVKIEADTAKVQRQLSDLWLLLVPVSGHA